MADTDKYAELSLRVGKLLRQERERRNLSMTGVASAAGLSQQMVSYVERGLRRPTLESLLRISDAVGVELAATISKAIFEFERSRGAKKP